MPDPVHSLGHEAGPFSLGEIASDGEWDQTVSISVVHPNVVHVGEKKEASLKRCPMVNYMELGNCNTVVGSLWVEGQRGG